MESIGAFLPLILIFGVFYILLIRPQQKKVKQHREMLNNLRRGDKIITSGGIIGTINKVSDNREMQVQVSENVEIKIAPGMVADLYTSTEPEKKQPQKENQAQNKGGLLSSLLGKKK
jgi:preprotein translocase subunit YajC